MEEVEKQEQPEISGPNGSNKIDFSVVVSNFYKELKRRSFSGRNPELGKMIKCQLCTLRHRESQCHMKDQVFAKRADGTLRIAKGQRAHPQANPFWRARPGIFRFIPGVDKFVRIVR